MFTLFSISCGLAVFSNNDVLLGPPHLFQCDFSSLKFVAKYAPNNKTNLCLQDSVECTYALMQHFRQVSQVPTKYLLYPPLHNEMKAAKLCISCKNISLQHRYFAEQKGETWMYLGKRIDLLLEKNNTDIYIAPWIKKYWWSARSYILPALWGLEELKLARPQHHCCSIGPKECRLQQLPDSTGFWFHWLQFVVQGDSKHAKTILQASPVYTKRNIALWQNSVLGMGSVHVL